MEGTTVKKVIAVIAVLVPVLAVTSGAFAAKKYVISSSSQIKNGVIKVSDLSPGAHKALRGEQGAKGDAGAAGPQGTKGDVGPAGADGKDGQDGKDAPAPEYGAGAVYVT